MHPITLVLFLDAHLLTHPLPISRRAHQLLAITVWLSLLDLVAAVQALVNPTPKETLAWCVTGASVEP